MRGSGRVSPVFFDGFAPERNGSALVRYRGGLVMSGFWLAVYITAAVLG
jgi:hypothetical protein